jgi:hypothetical protein
MHTVDLLEQALRVAERLGYKLRQDWLGGSGGGGCEIRGKKWLFVDLALSPSEQLDQVIETLRREQLAAELELPPTLRTLMWPRKAA